MKTTKEQVKGFNKTNGSNINESEKTGKKDLGHHYHEKKKTIKFYYTP